MPTISTPAYVLDQAQRRLTPSFNNFPGMGLLERRLRNTQFPEKTLADPPPGSGLKPVVGDSGLPILGHMIEMLRGDQPGEEPKHSLKLLTDREREILQLLSRGESNKAIAQTLSISYDTVKQHVRHILTKLNLSSRVKAAVLFTVEQQTQNNEER